MKRRMSVAIIAAMLMAVSLLALSACGKKEDTSPYGTYYLFGSEKTKFIMLSLNGWNDDTAAEGAYEIESGTITFKSEILGEQQKVFDGKIGNGVMKIYIYGVEMIYCKDGRKPSDFKEGTIQDVNVGDDKPTGDDNKPSGGETETKCTVIFDANGGIFENTMNSTKVDKIQKGDLLNAPDAPVLPANYMTGWTADADSGELWNFAEDKVTQDLTLYAVWHSVEAKIINFEGATVDEDKNINMTVEQDIFCVSLSDMITVDKGSEWKLYDYREHKEIPSKLADTSKKGYNDYYIIVTSFDSVVSNVYTLMIYRKYTVTVTYLAPNTDILKRESVETLSSFMPTYEPTFKGRTFNFWRIDKSDGERVTEPIHVTDNIWLYADITYNTYNVTFDCDALPQTVTYSQEYSFPVPEKTGYTFTGWYMGDTRMTDGEGNGVSLWYQDCDVALTAGWEVNKYKVQLNVNIPYGLRIGEGMYEYGSTVTVSCTPYPGFEVLGWYDKMDKCVTTDAQYTFVVGFDVRYTAKLKKIDELNDFRVTATPTACVIKKALNPSAEEIVIPDCVTEIDANAFENYRCLYKLVLGRGVETIGDNAFADCLRLVEIYNLSTLPIIAGTEHYGKLAQNALTVHEDITEKSGLEKSGDFVFFTDKTGGRFLVGYSGAGGGITLPSGNCEINKYAFTDNTDIVSVTVGEGVCSVGAYAFSGCTALTEINLPDTLTSFGEYAFSGCILLGGVSVPDSVMVLPDGIFLGCSALSAVTLPDKLLSIGGRAFADCIALASLSLPSELVRIEGGAFENCILLDGISLPSKLERIGGYAFSGCSALTGMDFPDTITYIGGGAFSGSAVQRALLPDSLLELGSSAFAGCVSLTAADTGSGIGEIAYGTFYGCTSLVAVTVGAGVQRIDEEAFSGCNNIKTVNFNAANCARVGDGARSIFQSSVGSISSVVIGGSVRQLPAYAFYRCSALENLTFEEGIESIGAYSFMYCAVAKTNFPHSLKNIYTRAFSNLSCSITVDYNGTVAEWGSVNVADMCFEGTMRTNGIRCKDGEVW